jgi:hypothetical protein
MKTNYSLQFLGVLFFSLFQLNAQTAYFESFDSITTPANMQNYGQRGWGFNTGAGYFASSVQDYTGNGGNYAWVDFSVPNQYNTHNYLETPSVYVGNLANKTLSFYHVSENGFDNHNNSLIIEFWNGSQWIGEDTLKGNNGIDWDKYTYNLETMTFSSSDSVKIRFDAVDLNQTSQGNRFYNDLLIDNIKIFNDCVTTDTITVSECTSYTPPSGNSTYTNIGTYQIIDTLVNSSNCDSLLYVNLTIKGFTTSIDSNVSCGGFQWINGNIYNSSDSTATDTLTNSTGCDSIVTLYLIVNNCYTCPDDINYCSASGHFDQFMWIAGVSSSNMNNPTMHSGGYADYKNQEPKEIKSSPNSGVNINLTPGFSYWPYTMRWRIFVDWNQNGDFGDTGEMIYTGVGKNNLTASFNIADTIGLGCYAMRVGNSWNSYPAACGNVLYGEYEDYTLSVENSNPQPRVSNSTLNPELEIDYNFEFSASQTVINHGQDIEIGFMSRYEGETPFYIYNTQGKQINSTIIYHAAGEQNIILPTANLPKGIYFISSQETVNGLKFVIH